MEEFPTKKRKIAILTNIQIKAKLELKNIEIKKKKEYKKEII